VSFLNRNIKGPSAVQRSKTRGFIGELKILGLVSSLVFVSGAALVQSKGKPQNTKKSTAKVLATSYSKDVLPVLTKYCGGCHSGKDATAGISVSKFKSEADVKKDLATWEKISKNLGSGHMPPKGMPQPSPIQRKNIVEWIDRTITGDCRLADPGRVTIRRLNREEYNNTIRDLVGLDLRLADDFPSDDVGYGFDNIGDVLSLSPLLMEKYMSAAEKIAKEAIYVPTSDSSRFEAEDSLNGNDGFGCLASYGSFKFQFKAPKPGMYRVKVRAYEDHAGPESAKMVLSLDGKPVQQFDVQARKRSPQMYEALVKIEGGASEIALTFTNDFYRPENAEGDRDRNLWIDFAEVSGPVGGAAIIPASHSRIIPGPPPTNNPREYARKILSNFASRAYRRPATPEEVERLLQIFDLAMKYKEPFERGIQLGVQATLVSPHFLFRAEVDPKANPNASRQLNGYELASRLSYFLWSSMPDDRLMGLAADGTLSKSAILLQEVQRMLKDPKSKALADNFASQWLNLRKLAIIHPDTKQFPQYNEDLRDAMMTETKSFFKAVVSQDRSVLDFIEGQFTYINGPLAKLYGIPNVTGPEFRKVSLVGTERAGILTQASVLTVTSNPTRTSPTKRGKWVLEQILGTPPPPPPPGVGILAENDGNSAGKSLREQLADHRNKPECFSCHSKMDPLGFGLENFDPIGVWRAMEGANKIDASGELPNGEKFVGPTGLRKYLMKNKELFVRSLSEKLLTYALGRGLDVSDRCHIDTILRATEKGKFKFSAMVNAVVQSDSFRRRGSAGASK